MGLHELHSLTAGPRVHRDGKLANMIRTKRGRIKKIDMGSTKATEQIISGKHLTQISTPAYMSPEFVKKLPTSQKTALLVDEWSWGVSLLELLTDFMPWFHLEFYLNMSLTSSARADYLLEADQTELDACMRANPAFSAVLASLGGQEAEDLFQVIQSALQPDVEKRASMRKLLSLPWFRPCRLAALKAAAEAEQQPCLPGAPVEVSVSAAGPGATYLELLQEWEELEGTVRKEG